MRYHMVALSLPREGYYLCLHKHGRRELCQWTEQDRDTLSRVRKQIEALYTAGPVGTPFSRPEVELLYIDGITPDQAVSRVLPYFLEATPPNQKRVYYLNAKESDVEVIGPAGVDGDKPGVRIITVAKNAGKFSPSPSLLQAIDGADLDTLEGRSSRLLAEAAAWSKAAPVTEGSTKNLVVPVERRVKLSRMGRDEVVTEIPEVWA